MIHKPTFKYMFMSHYATEVCKCPGLDLLAIARENDINNPSGIISQVLDVVSNFRSYCEGVDVNSSTCDIMQKELNEKYKSFK